MDIVVLFNDTSEGTVSKFVVFSLYCLFVVLERDGVNREIQFFIRYAVTVVIILFFSCKLAKLSFSSLLGRSGQRALLRITLPAFLGDKHVIINLKLTSGRVCNLGRAPCGAC